MGAEAAPRGLWPRFGKPLDGSFLRAAGTLQAGSLAISAVGFLASVVFARALGADGYGLLSLVISTGTTIGLLRRLGQDYAATTRMAESHAAGDRQGVRDALVFYVWTSVVTSVIVLPSAIALSPWIGQQFSADPSFGMLLPLYLVQGFWAVVAGGVVIALQASREISRLVRLETSAALLASLVPLSFAVAGLGVAGVLWGQIAASLVTMLIGLLAYARLVSADSLIPTVGTLARGIVRPAIDLWRETRFGLSIAIDKNLVSLYNLAPVLILGTLAAEAEVGQLRVALGYMAIPAALLSPISRLLMVDVPRLRTSAPDRVRPMFVRVTLLGCLVSASIAIPFAAVSVWVLPLIYGPDYATASPITYALLLDAATIGLGIAAGPIFRTYNRTDLPIVASVAILLVGLPGALFATGHWGAVGAALAYAGMVLASRLVSYVQCLRILRL